jgi:hypothetical protein
MASIIFKSVDSKIVAPLFLAVMMQPYQGSFNKRLNESVALYYMGLPQRWDNLPRADS